MHSTALSILIEGFECLELPLNEDLGSQLLSLDQILCKRLPLVEQIFATDEAVL